MLKTRVRPAAQPIAARSAGVKRDQPAKNKTDAKDKPKQEPAKNKLESKPDSQARAKKSATVGNNKKNQKEVEKNDTEKTKSSNARKVEEDAKVGAVVEPQENVRRGAAREVVETDEPTESTGFEPGTEETLNEVAAQNAVADSTTEDTSRDSGVGNTTTDNADTSNNNIAEEKSRRINSCREH